MLSARVAVATAGILAAALAGLVLLLIPEWFGVAILVGVLAQLAAEASTYEGSPRLQRLSREFRAHAPVLQAIRGVLLTVSAVELGSTLARATAYFFAVLLIGTRFLPRLVTRLVAPRMLIEGLPGAQEHQDQFRLFDSVSRAGTVIRTNIRTWTGWLEAPVVIVIIVVAADGLAPRDGAWWVYGAAVVALISLVLELVTFALSLIGQRNIRFHEKVVQALADYQPEYIVYFSAPATAAYQLRQWLPHLSSFPRRFAIITREHLLVPPVVEGAPGVPVISSPRLTLLDGLIPNSARAVLYVNNGMRNAHMLRHTHLRHVQMLHGESDKAPSANKFARAYDHIYVAGQAAIDRYGAYGIAMDPRAFRIVGRPQADAVRSDRPAGRPTVLYAPTWEGWNATTTESSVGVLGVELVRRLLARGDVRVIVRPHPTTGLATRWLLREVATMRSLIEDAGEDHVWSAPDGELSLVDCFNQCTVMIADISSVVADFLRSEKPLVVTDVDGMGTHQVRQSYPTAAAAWVLQPDVGNIDEILADVLGPDSLKGPRRDTRHYVLGDFDGPAEPVFHRTLAESIDEALHDLPRGAEEVVEELSD